MSHYQDLFGRILNCCPTALAYVNSEQHRLFTDTGEFSIAELFPTVLQKLMDDITTLGIYCLQDLDVLLDNPRHLIALIALREYFDRDSFKASIEDVPHIRQRITGILDSSDVESTDKLVIVLDICKHFKLGNQITLNEIFPLIEELQSKTLFQFHISAIVASCIPKSSLSEEFIHKYMAILHVVAILHPIWSGVWKYLSEQDLIPVEDTLCDVYYNKYTTQWKNAEFVERYTYLLEHNTAHITTTDKQTTDTCTSILQQHCEQSIAFIEYHNRLRQRPNAGDLTAMMMHLALCHIVTTKDEYKRYQSLFFIYPPNDVLTHMETRMLGYVNQYKNDELTMWISDICKSLRAI